MVTQGEGGGWTQIERVCMCYFALMARTEMRARDKKRQMCRHHLSNRHTQGVAMIK